MGGLMGDYPPRDGLPEKFAGNGFAGGAEAYHHTYILPAGTNEPAGEQEALTPAMFCG